jgi:hypothetical protein
VLELLGAVSFPLAHKCYKERLFSTTGPVDIVFSDRTSGEVLDEVSRIVALPMTVGDITSIEELSRRGLMSGEVAQYKAREFQGVLSAGRSPHGR